MSHRYDSLDATTLRQKACNKWQKYPADVLPLWVADMDFPIADEIKQTIRDYCDSDNFGYPPYEGLPGLKEAVIARQAERHNWHIATEDIYPINGIVPGLFLGVGATTSAGDDVIMQTPIYGPFQMAVEKQNRRVIANEMIHDGTHYRIDFDKLESQVTPATRLFMLCNPQNPVGRVFTRTELEQLADFVLRHRLWVVSDELHSDLIFSGQAHIPFASLSDDIAQRTITLFGPTKTFNLAGLKSGFLVAQNPALLERVKDVAFGLVGSANVIGQAATITAYQQGQAWLDDTLAYLEANRDFIAAFIKSELPQVKHTSPEGIYLAWLDFRALGVEDAETYMLEHARVGMNNGAWFGPGGAGFGRINFATSRQIVEAALHRIKDAVDRAPNGERVPQGA